MATTTIALSDKSSTVTEPPLPTGFIFYSPSSATAINNTDKMATEEITDNLENTKFIAQLEIVNSCSDVNSSFVLQASHDGTTWIDAVTISSDTQPDIIGNTAWAVDTVDYYAPKWRLVVNNNELDVGTTGTLKISYAVDTT